MFCVSQYYFLLIRDGRFKLPISELKGVQLICSIFIFRLHQTISPQPSVRFHESKSYIQKQINITDSEQNRSFYEERGRNVLK